jgi:hypothetical protein
VDDYPANLEVTCGQQVSEFPAIVDFLAWDYHYRSVATQISQDIELSVIPYMAEKPSHIKLQISTASCSTSSKHHVKSCG